MKALGFVVFGMVSLSSLSGFAATPAPLVQQSCTGIVAYIDSTTGATVAGPQKVFDTNGNYEPIKDRGFLFSAEQNMGDPDFIDLSVRRADNAAIVANFAGDVNWVKNNGIAQITVAIDANTEVLFSCVRK